MRQGTRRAAAQGFGWIEPSRVALAPPSVVRDEAGRASAPWVDPRWREEAAHVLAALAPFPADDRAAREALAQSLADLSFVERAALPEVIWPDGLRVPVRLRQPVACVAVGGAYYAVDADGVLLSGRWDAPPRRGGGWLPLVRLDPADVEHVAGDLAAGLATAVSLWEHVPPDARAPLGRVVIEPAPLRSGDPDGGGVRLVLEGERTAFFGRPPGAASPGELPPDSKWNSLLAALETDEATDGAPLDWEVVDLRWDRPELLLRADGSEGAGVR